MSVDVRIQKIPCWFPPIKFVLVYELLTVVTKITGIKLFDSYRLHIPFIGRYRIILDPEK